MATDNQSTSQPVIIEDQTDPEKGALGVTVVLKDDYSLDEHFKWLLDALGMEKAKYKRLNREAVGKKIDMWYWVRGPPVAYYAAFLFPTGIPFEHEFDFDTVCRAPGVARVIKCDLSVARTFLRAYRQPLMKEWSKSGPPNPNWFVSFDDKEYTTTQHFEAIGRKIPFAPPYNAKERFNPDAVEKGYYETADSVTEEEIMAVFADPHVKEVRQTGKNEIQW